MTDQFVNMSFQIKGLKGDVFLTIISITGQTAQSKCIRHPFPLVSQTKREEGQLITA